MRGDGRPAEEHGAVAVSVLLSNPEPTSTVRLRHCIFPEAINLRHALMLATFARWHAAFQKSLTQCSVWNAKLAR